MSPFNDWLPSEIESVQSCPVCGSVDSVMLYDDITDDVCPGNAGTWTLHQCDVCSGAYLNPRPTRESIGKAYTSYHTHVNPVQAVIKESESIIRRLRKVIDLRRRISDDMLYSEFGIKRRGRLPGTGWLMRFFFDAGDRERWDIRHLPNPMQGQSKLLDVGCGNGSFLRAADALGYEAWGLEPDPRAAALARESGFKIVEGVLPGARLPVDSFDQITGSHVIEHMHDPLAAAQQMFGMLKPGGRLWLTTPNLDSIGRRTFGKYWRGIESPRHLFIFNQKSLRGLLAAAGFVSIQFVKTRPEAESYFSSSLALARSRNSTDYFGNIETNIEDSVKAANKIAENNMQLGESILVVAYRPLENAA